MFTLIRNWLRRFAHFAVVGVFLLPFTGRIKSTLSTTDKREDPKNSGDEVVPYQEPQHSLEDVIPVLSDEANREYANYLINNTANQRGIGIQLDDVRNKILIPGQTNQTISSVFTEDDSMVKILRLFHPELSSSEVRVYLDRYPIVVGQDVDRYLEDVRKGSWGTTLMTVDVDGKLHFESISLRTPLVDPEYQDNANRSLEKLVREEFFQAHQYNAVVAQLYNDGYLAEVAGLSTPESVAKEISIGNLRAFLELFPQQKYLFDEQLGANSYNFSIDGLSFPGPAATAESINPAYQALVDFIRTELGISCSPQDFLDPKKIRGINDAFRAKYGDHYRQLGFTDTQIQIWNLVGMQRNNKANPENSMILTALLNFPDEKQG